MFRSGCGSASRESQASKPSPLNGRAVRSTPDFRSNSSVSLPSPSVMGMWKEMAREKPAPRMAVRFISPVSRNYRADGANQTPRPAFWGFALSLGLLTWRLDKLTVIPPLIAYARILKLIAAWSLRPSWMSSTSSTSISSAMTRDANTRSSW